MAGKGAKRRLVQSTLFPRPESSIKGGENCGGDRGEGAAEEEKECVGSKTRSGSKRKCNSKPPSSPNKVIENGEEISSEQVDNGSSAIIKPSFFLKASEKRHQKRKLKEPVLIESPIDNGEKCSPPSIILFPRPESSIKGGVNGDSDRGEGAAEQEECVGSKKRSRSKRKCNSKLVTMPPASPKKVIENGEEISSEQVDNGSSAIIKPSFFLKASEKRHQKRQQKGPVLVESPIENGEKCSPPSIILFPRPESSIKGGENGNGNRGEGAAEEEKDCGANKKRSGSKRKCNSKLVMMPQASPKKVIENSEEISSEQVDNGSSAIIKPSFFLKASEKRRQKRQQKEPVLIESPIDNGEKCSPPSSRANAKSTPRKTRRQNNLTPKNERRNSTPSKKLKSGKRESCCKQIPFDIEMDEQKLLTIPDLRLEAKLSAEENSRVFSGKQIHPFFTSRKGGKSSQDLADSDSKWSSERKEKGIAFNLIHVFEDVEDDLMNLNWGDWVFSESRVIDDLDCGCSPQSPVYEGSVDSLNFDNFLNFSNLTRTSLYKNSHMCPVPEKAFHGLPSNPECSLGIARQMDSDMMPEDADDILVTSVKPMLQYYTKKFDHLHYQDHILEISDICDGVPCGGSVEPEMQDRLLEERIMSQSHTSQIQTKNCLWTDKYQPQNAKQICGNGEPVKSLSEWLQLWHKRGSQTSAGCIDEDYSDVQDTDHDYQETDSDTDSGEEDLKNVLLVTGPVGSGKSAAIYACARDQGFQIIEINASDWRNGPLVKQKFGEAVESHWHQRAVENATKPDNKSVSKFFKALNKEGHSNEVIEVTPLLDQKDSPDAVSWPMLSVSGSNQPAKSQGVIKTLILFEDVDANVQEDHGFITAIQQLAETAKRPMILTSNSDNPVLPKNLDRLELSFSVPSVQELLGLVSVICGAEKANIHPCLIERFVNYCQGDIRKTIMLLQFWCQGQTHWRGNELHATYWPLLFDIDAGHHMLPRVIHWGYPSHLSDLVADEINKSLTLLEEADGLMDTNIVQDLTENNIHMDVAERDPVEVKKEAMLRHCSLEDAKCEQFEPKCELFDFSTSPCAYSRQNSRRKINMVLSSDSEDEILNTPLVSAGCDIDTNILDGKNEANPHFNSEVEKLDNDCQRLEIGYCSQTEDTCKSLDMSCVPESSFVPESDFFNKSKLYSATVSYGDFINTTGDIHIFQEQDSILGPSIGSQPTQPLHPKEVLENGFDLNTACVDPEEIGDSLSKSEVGVLGRYQPLDECSRVDFTRRLEPPMVNSEPDQPIDFVKEAWKKLHDRSIDLNKYVTAEEKTVSRGLLFGHRMSDLISDTDLLLKDCQDLELDSCVKSHSHAYYDNQLEMSSVLAQHGICFYSKEISSLGSVVGSTYISDLASEMLSSSASSVALGKLASQDQSKVDRSKGKTTKNPNLLTSISDSGLSSILQTVVPPRSYLSAKGAAFHEYASALSQISRYEDSRISECTQRNQRRARTPRHYLSSGSLRMSPEEISLLRQYSNCYQTQL